MSLNYFHPVIRQWFADKIGTPTAMREIHGHPWFNCWKTLCFHAFAGSDRSAILLAKQTIAVLVEAALAMQNDADNLWTVRNH
jgi:hypothetical protein